jgi:hypothetical protein
MLRRYKQDRSRKAFRDAKGAPHGRGRDESRPYNGSGKPATTNSIQSKPHPQKGRVTQVRGTRQAADLWASAWSSSEKTASKRRVSS